MTQSGEQSPTPEALEKGYEPSDANYNGLLMFVVFFLLTAVVLHTGLWVLLNYYLELPRAEDQRRSSVPMAQRFPAPNLQPSVEHNKLPWQDLADLHRQEQQVFQEMGWKIDPQTQRPAVPADIVRELAQHETRNATTRPANQGSGGRQASPPASREGG